MFKKTKKNGWFSPEPHELAALRASLIGEADVHAYLLSRIDRVLAGESAIGQFYLFRGGTDQPQGLIFVGEDFNFACSHLSVVARDLLGPHIIKHHRGLSIAVSPAPEVAALVTGLASVTTPQLHRHQSLYVLRPDEPLGDPGAEPLLVATPEDVPHLIDASIGLANEDLQVPIWRITRNRVEKTVRKRLEQGRTFVIRRGEQVVFKVDIAVHVPEVILVEGVYTHPAVRNQGLAAGGMAQILGRLQSDRSLVSLHVNQDNGPARRVYEKAGMHLRGELGLVLFGFWQ